MTAPAPGSRIILKGGTIVSSEGEVRADLLIDDGRIVALDADLSEVAGEAIDVGGDRRGRLPTPTRSRRQPHTSGNADDGHGYCG